MNPHTNQARRRIADRICDFLNQRFGYSFALDISLEAHGIGQDMRGVMLNLARNRQIDEFKELLRIHASYTMAQGGE